MLSLALTLACALLALICLADLAAGAMNAAGTIASASSVKGVEIGGLAGGREFVSQDTVNLVNVVSTAAPAAALCDAAVALFARRD